MPPVAPHDTQVVDQQWDGPAQEARIQTPVTKAVGTGMWAWYDPNAADDNDDGYPDAKSGWKFPHHEVNADGRPGAANVRACRNGLSRLGQNPNIPDADKDGVRKHLQHHLDAFNANKSLAPAGGIGSLAGATAGGVLWAIALLGKRLALRPDLVSVLQASLAAGEQPPALAQLPVDPGDDDEEYDQPDVPVAVIPLCGLITPYGSLLSMLFGLGGGGLAGFRASLQDAVNDSNIEHIVLDIDSPGGLVDLVPETAAEVRAAREIKPITAVANTEAASAAYWIASQANELVVTPSGMVGSVGVYMMHRDISAAMEMDGIKTTLISAGKYKVEGNPYEPLGNEARQSFQADIDELYGMFVADVAAGRNVSEAQVRDGFGQGRTVMPSKATGQGMVDRVATLDQTVQDVITQVSAARGTSSASQAHARALAELL